MRRAIVLAAWFALLAPIQLRAQDTAADDLRCAAWAALAIAVNEEPDVRSSLAMALIWYLGRYEVATGIPFERALTPDYLEGIVPELAAAEPECKARFQAMGQRMSDHGQVLQRSGR